MKQYSIIVDYELFVEAENEEQAREIFLEQFKEDVKNDCISYDIEEE